jgi:hypothetical protein
MAPFFKDKDWLLDGKLHALEHFILEKANGSFSLTEIHLSHE